MIFGNIFCLFYTRRVVPDVERQSVNMANGVGIAVTRYGSRGSLRDFVTVNASDDVRVIFKNGTNIVV